MVEPAATTPPGVPAETPKPPRKKRGRWLRRGFLFLLLLGTVGWFTPTIIARTELRNQLPKYLLPNLPVTVHLGDTSLSWLSPIVINDLRLVDDRGNRVLELKQFSTSLPLWNLITVPEELGTFTIEEPIVHLSIKENGSNLEDLLQQFSSKASSSSLVGYTVDLHKGRIDIVHLPTDRATSIEPISVRLTSSHGKLHEVDVAVGTPPAVDGADSVADWIAAKLGGSSDNSTAASASQHLMLRASHWKLDRLAPLLARLSPQAELAGELQADVTITLTPVDDQLDVDWSGTLSIQQLLVAGLESLKRDRVLLNEIAVSGRAATNGGRLALHDLKMSTDVGELTATGDVPLNVQSNRSSVELLQSLLSDEDYHIDGHVDLKKLAALLPQTLRVREGTEITAGDLKLQLVGGDINGARRWSGNAGITGLKAINQGKTIPWDQPIVARVNAHREGTAIKVDLVECKSDFLQIAGNGTLDDARFTAIGDLSKLVSNLERFVDLGIEQLSGQMKASGELKRRDDQHVELTSKVVLDNFAYVVTRTNTWREKHLELTVAAAGKVDARPTLTQIDSGEVHLASSGDSLDLVLKQPINLIASSSGYAATARLKGNLASWQNRLRTTVAIDNWTVGGGVDLATTVSGNASTIDVAQLTCALQMLEVRGPEWLIQDPDARLETTGKWNLETRTWTSPKTSLIGKTVSVEVADLECGLGKSGLSKLVGMATYRADMAQVSGWKNLAIPNPSHYLIGSLTGTASITRQADQFKGMVDAQVEKFVLAGRGTGQPDQPQWVALWKEPQIKVGGQGTYNVTADKLELESSHFDVVGLSLGATGKLENCSTQERIDLSGNIDYDWDALANRFGPQVNQGIRLTGKDRRPFSLHGSLASLSQSATTTQQGVAATSISFPATSQPPTDTSSSINELADLTGQAGLGWTAANIYGIQAGAGDVSVQLDRSVCRFAPIDLTVNDGKLHTTPTIYLDRNPFTLVLLQEKMIDQVSLSPELCNNWLKFVTPMLAGSAQVDGKLAVDLRGASFPLTAPKFGSADGLLTIHHAQAKPGPLALQIINTVEQIQSMISRRQPQPANQSVSMQMPEQQIPFKLEQGRVYHQGLTLLVDDVTVRTSGSVGLDSTLNITAEVGVRDEWIGNNNALAGLKGKSIPIQIVGSTSQPQIDPSTLRNLAQQLGGSAIKGLIQDKVGNGLDRVIDNGLDKLLKGKK